MIGDAIGRAGERAAAAAALVLIPATLRLTSLRTALALCDRWPPLAQRHAPPHALADRARRWLSRGRGPWASSCLTRSMVLYAMLRQHGYAPALHIGVRGEGTSFVAHAWVSVGGRAVADDARVADEYRELLIHRA